MSRSTSSVVWTVAGGVAAVLIGIGVIFGPRLVREGREMIGPVVELSRAEKELDAWDKEVGFEPPADGRISPERLEAFLSVRRELEPVYERWNLLERQLERQGEEWQQAKEALAGVREVFAAQTAALRRSSMPPSEFRWLEREVYDRWLTSLPALDSGAAEERVRELTRADLEFVAELRRRNGPSSALDAVERRLEERLASVAEAQARPIAEIGPNDELLMAHRAEIVALRLEEHSGLHARLREGGRSVHVKVDRDGEPDGVLVELGPEATPKAPAATP